MTAAKHWCFFLIFSFSSHTIFCRNGCWRPSCHGDGRAHWHQTRESVILVSIQMRRRRKSSCTCPARWAGRKQSCYMIIQLVAVTSDVEPGGRETLSRRNPWAGPGEPELQGPDAPSSLSSVFWTWCERADWHRLQVQFDVLLHRGAPGVSWSRERSAGGGARTAPSLKFCFCPKVWRIRWRRTKRWRVSRSREGFLWTDRSQSWSWL